MLKIDHTTSIILEKNLLEFVWRLTLIKKKLVLCISIMGSELNIEYEGLHQIYFSCKKYGHRSDSCYENQGVQDQ
ncbi:hypothetical protein AHAS_Ahas17G0158600 [Arachis hypogaea]